MTENFSQQLDQIIIELTEMKMRAKGLEKFLLDILILNFDGVETISLYLEVKDYLHINFANLSCTQAHFVYEQIENRFINLR